MKRHYTVLRKFTLNRQTQKRGHKIELTPRQASHLRLAGFIGRSRKKAQPSE